MTDAITDRPSIENNQDNEKYPNFEVKIDKSEPNQKRNMSESEPKKSKIAMASLKMPDGKEVEILATAKGFQDRPRRILCTDCSICLRKTRYMAARYKCGKKLPKQKTENIF